MAVTIGTSTTATATFQPPQRLTFYANFLYWAFYCDGSNLVYRTSADCINWSAPTVVRACSYGEHFSIRHKQINSTLYVYYAYCNGSYNNPAIFRRGAIVGNTIIWEAERNARAGYSDQRYCYPDLCIDSNNAVYVFFALWYRYSAFQNWQFPWVCRNPNNDGTGAWTNFNLHAAIISDYWFMGGIVTLNSGRVYCVYVHTVGFWGKLWDGAAWGAEETPDASANHYQRFGLSSKDDDVYFGFHDFVDSKIYFRLRTFGVGWGAREQVVITSPVSPPHLCIDESTGDVYAFWVNRHGLNETIYCNKRVAGVWGTPVAVAVGEIYPKLYSINCFWDVTNNIIGVAWTAQELSPFNVRYACYSTVAPPVQAGLKIEKVMPLLLDE